MHAKKVRPPATSALERRKKEQEIKIAAKTSVPSRAYLDSRKLKLNFNKPFYKNTGDDLQFQKTADEKWHKILTDTTQMVH